MSDLDKRLADDPAFREGFEAGRRHAGDITPITDRVAELERQTEHMRSQLRTVSKNLYGDRGAVRGDALTVRDCIIDGIEDPD